MADLTPAEKKEAFQAFHKGAVPALAVSVFIGSGLNLFGPRSVVSSAAAIAIFVGGIVLGIVLGLKRRREAIAAMATRRQSEAAAPSD